VAGVEELAYVRALCDSVFVLPSMQSLELMNLGLYRLQFLTPTAACSRTASSPASCPFFTASAASLSRFGIRRCVLSIVVGCRFVRFVPLRMPEIDRDYVCAKTVALMPSHFQSQHKPQPLCFHDSHFFSDLILRCEMATSSASQTVTSSHWLLRLWALTSAPHSSLARLIPRRLWVSNCHSW
jgi:hypothetical protein